MESLFEEFKEALKIFNLKHEDIHITLNLTPKEALRGTKKKIKIPVYDLSLQEKHIENINTPFGNLNITKSNGRFKKVLENRLLIKTPRKVRNNVMFCINGKGNINKCKRGNLYIHVNIKNEPNYK